MKRFAPLLAALLIALPAAADSPIIYFGTHSKDLSSLGMAFKDGNPGQPSMSFLSTPNTGLFLDGSGNVSFTKGGGATLAVGTGLSFPAGFTPVNGEGNIAQHTFQTNINPAANVTAGSNRMLAQLEENIGTDDSGFSVDQATGLQVNVNSRNKSSWTNIGVLQLNSTIGNGTDPQTGNDIHVGSISGSVQSGATVNFYEGLELDLNAVAGSTIGNYIGVNTNAQINAASNYTGIHLGDGVGTLSGAARPIDATTNVTGSISQYHGVSLGGNIASITGGYDGFHAAHNITSTNGAQTFTDSNSVGTLTGGSNYGSFGTSPNIGSMTGVFTGYRSFPVIGTANGITGYEEGSQVTTSGTSYFGFNVHPNLTGMTGDLYGLLFTPTATTTANATGISIDMTGVTAGGTKTAITTNGAPVNVNNADLSVNTGALHVAAPTQAFVNVGNPSPVHNINTNYVAPANTVVTNADSFGLGPVSTINLGHDSHITSGGLRLGTASLGMIGLMTLDDSSDIQDVGGSFIAQVLTGGTGAGGVVGNAYGYRYVAGNFGSPSSITNARAFFADDPLGVPATNSWGAYVKNSFENYLGKSLKIGGAANGTNDKVSNASVGLEIEGKAFYPQPMTTAARNALTALHGMLINNVTTGNLEIYDGSAWQTVQAGGGSFVPTSRNINTTAPLTGGGDLSADRTIAMPAAATAADGYLTQADWNTFNGKQSALSFGNLTDAGTDGITVTGGTGAVIGSGTSLSQHVADSTHNGYLSSGDWSTFNGKSNLTSPLTTKGDLWGFSTVNARVPVGTNGQVLTADSTQTTGVKWATPTTGTVTSVDVSGGSTGLTTSGGPVTGSGTITIAGTLGIPNGGTGQTTKAAAFDALQPMTTAGDTIYGGASGTGTRLAAGTAHQVLHSGTTPGWGPVDQTADITGATPIGNGGTGQTTKAAAFDALQPMTTAGDIIYGGASGTGTRLAAGTAAQFLGGGTTPAWTSTLTKGSSADGLTLNNNTSTAGHKSTLVLKAGDGTASTENTWISFQANETSPQEWQEGMLGGKSWQLNDVTASGTSMIIVPSGGASGVKLTGVTNGSSAASGIVGEEIFGSLARSSGTTLTSGTAKTVTSITLTAGDWDLSGAVAYNVGGASTLSTEDSAISLTTNATPAADTIALCTSGEVRTRDTGFAIAAGGEFTQSMGPCKVTISSSTTYYLTANGSLTGTVTAYGSIRARRIR